MDVSAALGTITAIGELTKLVVSSKVDSEVKAKAAELNNSILSLQGTLFALQSQNQELLQDKNNLKNKLVEISNWNKEASRYQLIELCTGVFVYSLKKGQGNAEPAHYLCPSCYQSGKKSILQSEGKRIGGTKHFCVSPLCKSEFNDFNSRRDPSF